MNYRFLTVWLGFLIGPLIRGSLSAMQPLVSQQNKLPSLSNCELVQVVKALPKELRLYVFSLLIEHTLGLNFSLAQEVNVGSSVDSVTISPDGKTFYTASADGIIRLWDRATGDQLHQFNGYGLVTFSSTGSAFLISYQNEAVILRDITANQNLHRFKHSGRIKKVEFSPHGKTFLTLSQDEARLWDAETGCLLNSFYPTESYLKKLLRLGAKDFFRTATYSSDGKAVITASDYGEICFMDVDTGVVIGSFKVENLHEGYIDNLICSKNGKLLVASSITGLFIWDVETGQQRKLLPKPSSDFYKYIALSPDGNTLVASMADFYAFRIWNIQEGRPLSRIVCNPYLAKMLADLVFTPDLAFSLDGNTLFTISAYKNSIVSIWNTCSKKLSCFSERQRKEGYAIFLDYYRLVNSDKIASCFYLEGSAEDEHRNDSEEKNCLMQ